MGIIIRPVPGSIDPASIEDETERLKRESEAQVRLDYPTATFRDGAPVEPPATEPPPLPGPRAPNIITIGNPNAKNRLDGVAAPVPEKEKIGWFSSMARGLGERTTRIAGFIPDTANTVADIMPEWLDQGLVIDDDGVRWEKGEEYAKVSLAKKAGKAADEADLGSKRGPLATPDEIKAQWEAGDKWSAAGNAAQFAVEQGLLSLPDMVAAVASFPLYWLGQGGDYAQQRAAADGRTKATPADAVIAAVTSTFVSAMERFGAGKVFDLVKTVEKTKLRKWFEGIAAEAGTEAVQNPAELVGTKAGTAQAEQITPGALAEQAGFGALGGIGGGAAIGGGVQLLSGRDRPPPAAAVPPSAPGRPPTPPPAGAAPAAPPAIASGPGPGAPPAPGIPKAGDALLFQPTSAPGVVVVVQKISPESGSAIVSRVDEAGDPVLNEDGEPESFVATFADLKLSGVPAPSVAAAPKPAVAAPPAATSVEPTSDIVAQVKDLWNAKTPRRGVYVSPPTVAKMKQEGSYPDLLKTGVVEENFDGQGGTLIVKSKKDLDEARFARDSGMVDMQAIVGKLTGAGIAKPKTPKPAVVQRKDETGAVVQQSAVEPAAVPAAVAAVKDLPGTVEVTTPEAVIKEREVKVTEEIAPTPASATGFQAGPEKGTRFRVNPKVRSTGGVLLEKRNDNLGGTGGISGFYIGKDGNLMEVPGLNTPAVHNIWTPESEAARTQAAAILEQMGSLALRDPKRAVLKQKLRELVTGAKAADEITPTQAPAARPTPGDAFSGTDFAILFATKTLNTPKEGNLTKTDVRASAQAVGVAAQMLRQAASEAGKRGAPPEVVAAATDVAGRIERIGEKPEIDFVKGRGVSEFKLRARLVEIQNAFRALADWRDKPRVAEPAGAVKAKAASRRTETAGDKKVAAVLAKPKVVEKAEKAFKAEQERRASKGSPPEGVAERRRVEPAPTEVGPTGVRLAPPGERIVHRKKKYVPPKKREEDVVAKVAEKTAPAQIETIELSPSAVTGDEEAFITELMGSTPQELQQEMRLDPSGQMSRVLVGLVKAMGDRNSWAGWFAAVTRGGIMSHVQRNQMMGLIREYVAAERTQIPEIREKLLGLLTNVDGKTLPQPAIAAVFEAANLTRAYTTMALAVRDAMESTDTDLGQISEATGDTAFDPALVKKDTGSLSVVREGEIGGTARTKPVFEIPYKDELLSTMLKLASDFAPIRKVLDQLTAVAQTNRFINGIMARSLQAQVSRGTLPGTHEILDGILANAVEVNVPLTAQRFLRQLRAAMPDLPVEFVPVGQPMRDEHGGTGHDPGGRFLAAGMLQVQVSLDSKGLPIWTPGRMQTLLHEMYHAATVYELNRSQDSALIHEITQLRAEIVKKAQEKMGRDIVNDIIMYHRGELSAAPEHLEEFSPYLYALTNNFELVAEGPTSPYFQQFLRSLDQTPTKSWYRSTWNAMVRMASRLLGFKNPADNRLLNDLLLLVQRTMAAQRGRQQRIQAARDKAVSEIQAVLKVPPEKIIPLVDSIFSGEGAMTVAKKWDGSGFFEAVDAIRVARGSMLPDGRLESSDRMAFRAYTAGPATLGEHIRTTREEATRGRFEAPPHLRNHEQIAALTTPRLANVVAGVRRLMTSRFVDGARDRGLGFLTTDFLVSRGARLFGIENDSTNPLVAWKRLRDTRRSHANRLLELAEKTVNSKWIKMSPHRSEAVGTMLQQTTQWQIDPEQGKQQTKLLLDTSQGAWEANVDELNAAWARLDDDQKDLYRSVQKYFKQEYSQIRRAGIDLAIDLFGGQITDQQRTMLYTLRNADGIDQLVGTGKFIDLGDQNEKFAKVVRDLIRVSTIKGPYFPLMRKGNLVVEAAREGVLNDGTGRPRNFDTKAEAQAQADAIRTRAPKNTARVVEESGKYQVKYKMRHVSFHESQKDAVDAQAQLRAQGFETGVFTRKLESVEAASLSEGLKELISKAESVALTGTQPAAEQRLVIQTLQSAFVQILAERAASASQQLKRQGVEGPKGKEAHEIFARRTKASSWHYANLKTALAQSKALSRLRTFTRDPTQGTSPANIDAQNLVLSRGRTLHEITKRLRVEADELDSLDKMNMDFYLGQLGFINFLATPSYALVNAMQNFNVAMPYLTGKYGLKGAKALLRGMKVITGPTFAKAMRGLVSKPGEVTVYDVYSAISEAVAEHPRYAQFTKAQGSRPSALQQLVDMGVINASFIQELAAVANNESLTVSRGMEWLRLFPQGAELWNRISTALAVLEVTNGDVEAAADAVWKVHFGYDIENRPRYFRKVGGTRLPQAITMFKMYGVGMYQLTGSLIVDTISRRGQSRTDRGRAATALAGIIAAHVLSAGVIGGVMLEPLRLLMNLWHAMFGDDDEYYNLDTMVQRWAKEVTESDLGGRILSRGLWNALGFDLSGRMGLDRILMYDPPESFTENELWKTLGGLLGPIPSMLIQKSTRAYQLATVQGKPFEAIMEAIPVRMLQDARKAWKLINEGVTTPAGDVLMGPENFDWLDVVGRAGGLQTTEEAKLSDQASTAFGYRGWRTARVRQLTASFWRAHDAGDVKAEAEAVADIELFNQKNPGAPVTAASLRQSRQTARRNVRERTGEGRNPDLNKLLDY